MCWWPLWSTVNRYAVRYGMRDPTGELYQLYHSQVDIDGVLVIWKETQKPAVQQAWTKNFAVFQMGFALLRPTSDCGTRPCSTSLKASRRQASEILFIPVYIYVGVILIVFMFVVFIIWYGTSTLIWTILLKGLWLNWNCYVVVLLQRWCYNNKKKQKKSQNEIKDLWI